jgi:hypothetical protein
MALTRRAIRSAAEAGSSHSGLDDDEVVFGEPVLIWVERRRGGTGHALLERLGRFAFEFGVVHPAAESSTKSCQEPANGISVLTMVAPES